MGKYLKCVWYQNYISVAFIFSDSASTLQYFRVQIYSNKIIFLTSPKLCNKSLSLLQSCLKHVWNENMSLLLTNLIVWYDFFSIWGRKFVAILYVQDIFHYRVLRNCIWYSIHLRVMQKLIKLAISENSCSWKFSQPALHWAICHISLLNVHIFFVFYL